MIGSGSPIVMELIKTLVVRATKDSVARRYGDAWSGNGAPADGAGISATERAPPSAKRIALSRRKLVVIGQALPQRNVSVPATCGR